ELRAPAFAKHLGTHRAVRRDVGMVDLGQELELGRLEGIPAAASAGQRHALIRRARRHSGCAAAEPARANAAEKGKKSAKKWGTRPRAAAGRIAGRAVRGSVCAASGHAARRRGAQTGRAASAPYSVGTSSSTPNSPPR